MCTLAIYFQTSAEFPIVVAANRDEFYGRPATAPHRLLDDPWAVGGQDLVAGGTWLGVNAHNLVAGVLNRRSDMPPDPARRSRGHLCLDVLRQATVGTVVARVGSQPAIRYNPFNLLVASPEAACVLSNISGAMVTTGLTPGIHLLTNLELNDFECPRIAKSYSMFEAAQRWVREATLATLLDTLHGVLADHSTPLDPRANGLPNNLCVHTQCFGTRSSTLLVYAARTARFRMWHAAGPPCQTEYHEVALPEAVANGAGTATLPTEPDRTAQNR